MLTHLGAFVFNISLASSIVFGSWARATPAKNRSGSTAEVVGTPTEAENFHYAQSMYKDRRMDEFFGVANWVRIKHWPRLSTLQKDRWLSLELTALARHCRWSDINRLYRAEGSGLAMAEEAMSLIRMKEEYRRFLGDEAPRAAGVTTKLDRARENWGATSRDYERFTSPEQLRVHVESLCRD